MQGTSGFCSRICTLAAVLAVILAAPSAVLAQKAPKGKPAQPAQPAGPSQEEVRQLATEAQAAEAAGNLAEAVDKYQKLYDLVPDPNLLIKIGDLHRQNADNAKAEEAWKLYQEKAPPLCDKLNQATCEANKDNTASPCAPKYSPTDDGTEMYETCVPRYSSEVQERIDVIAKERVEQAAKDKEEAERIAREAEEKRKADEELKRLEAEKLPMALSAMVVLGADQRTTVIGRLLAGGMLRFGKFAPEAHIAFEGFLRADNNKGTQAQSFTVIDLGARYAFVDEQFAGPFVGVAGGFGLFLGSPRDVNLTDDSASCAGFDGNNCTIQVNRHLNGRVGLGYGFKSGEKATVAIRLDYNLWWYSVDTDQPDGVPVGQIELPQLAHAITIGLEFLRWR